MFSVFLVEYTQILTKHHWISSPTSCLTSLSQSFGMSSATYLCTLSFFLRPFCRAYAKADVNRDGNSPGGRVEPPVPLRQPPTPPPAAEGTPPPLPERPSPGGKSARPGQRPPARPLPAQPLPAPPSAGKGNFWLAKAGLTRKKRDGMSPASAPATPPRNGGAWHQGGGTRTPPPTFSAGRTAAGVVVAAKVLDAIGSCERPSGGATGAWAKLRRR